MTTPSIIIYRLYRLDNARCYNCNALAKPEHIVAVPSETNRGDHEIHCAACGVVTIFTLEKPRC